MSTADDHPQQLNYYSQDDFQMMTMKMTGSSGSSSEIEEEQQYSTSTSGGMVQALDAIREEDDQVVMMEGASTSSLFSLDIHNNGSAGDAVYVALLQQQEEGNIGKESSSSSMNALLWTLNHAVNIHPSSSSTPLVFLLHVFPEIKHIPMPLGMMPVSQVNPEQKENYMAQEMSKRRAFLDKFLNTCSTAKVKVDTILIESDMEAKAILDLIPILNIRKLVLGTTKANLRKMRSKKANGIINQILQGAPEFCEIKIICEGKEMLDLIITDSPSPSPRGILTQPLQDQELTSTTESFRCGCFKLKVLP